MSQHTEIINILNKKINQLIQADLTLGKTDNDLPPFNENQINDFITNHKNKIELTIQQIIDAYTEDNELESLYNPEDDWIREFLYENVKTLDDSDNE